MVKFITNLIIQIISERHLQTNNRFQLIPPDHFGNDISQMLTSNYKSLDQSQD